jgi:hypothetical protein
MRAEFAPGHGHPVILSASKLNEVITLLSASSVVIRSDVA